MSPKPTDHGGARRFPSGEYMDPNALPGILRSLEDRVVFLEQAQAEARAHRSDLSERVVEIVERINKRLEAHDVEMAEFRKSTSQIAHVLQGPFGSEGLITQMQQMRIQVSGLHQTVGVLKTRVPTEEDVMATRKSDRLLALSAGDDDTSKHDRKQMKKIIDVLLKVILALVSLLGAAVFGSKYLNKSDEPPSSSQPATTPTPKGP